VNRIITAIIVCLCFVFSNFSAWTQDLSNEELLETLKKHEELFENQQAEIDRLSEENESISTDIAEFIGEIDIHGFLSQGYMKSTRNNFLMDSKKGSFQYTEIGINFAKDLTEDSHIGLQLFSRDLGAFGNNEVILDWAYFDYHWRDWLGFRIGKMKIPLGLFNETRDLDMLRTCILLPSGVYNETWREALVSIQGVGMYGGASLGMLGDLGYQFLYGVTNFDNDGGVARSLETSTNKYLVLDEIEVNYMTAANLLWDTPLDGFRLGASYLATRFKVDGNSAAALGPIPKATPLETKFSDLHIAVFSANYSYEDLNVVSEYSTLRSDTQLAASAPFGVLSTDKVNIQAYYGGLSYRFTNWFELGSYYSVYYRDKNDTNGYYRVREGDPAHFGWIKDIALSSRFDITDNWIFKAECHWMDGTGIGTDHQNIGSQTHRDWFLFAFKTSIYF